MIELERLQQLANEKAKVRVQFESGAKKWGYVHKYDGAYYLTRGNRVGFSLRTAQTIEKFI